MAIPARADKTPHSLSDMRVEKRIEQAHKRLSESVKQCPKTFFIWDTNIFHSFVNEIKYFASLNLITPEDVRHLKEELHQLLSLTNICQVKESLVMDERYISICLT